MDKRTLNRSSAGSGGRKAAMLLLPILLVSGILGLLLPLAFTSPWAAAGIGALLFVVILAGVLGAARASTVMLVLAFGFAPLTSFAIGPRPLVVASAFFVFAFVFALPRLIHEPLRLPAMFVVGGLFFTVMGLLSVPVAINSRISFSYLVVAVFALLMMPAAMVWMRPSEGQMYVMVLAFGIGTAVSTLVGIPRHEFRNSGLTYHPVALGYTAMLTLSMVPFLLASKARSRWLLVPPIAVVALMGIWTSGSRTGVLVLVILGLVVPMVARSIMLGVALIAGAVIAGMKLLTYDPSRNPTSALSRMLGTGGARDSDETRLSTLRDGLDQIQSNPILGHGYSTEHTYVIHNIYLQVLAAEGLLGLVGLLLMLAALAFGLRSKVRLRRYLSFPALAAILAGPFQPNMGDHYLGMCLGLSLIASAGFIAERRNPAPDGPDEGGAAGRGARHAESATEGDALLGQHRAATKRAFVN